MPRCSRNNRASWNTERQRPGQNGLGHALQHEVASMTTAQRRHRGWQQNFAVQTVDI